MSSDVCHVSVDYLVNTVNILPSGISDCPSITIGVPVSELHIEAVCEEVFLDVSDVHLNLAIVPDMGEVDLKDYSLFLDDIVDVYFLDVLLIESLAEILATILFVHCHVSRR